MLQSFLLKIKDHRRKQGQRYQLEHILLFSAFAILSNATSYRKVHAFIKSHYETLDKRFDLNWKYLPAYTSIRAIIQGTSSNDIEQGFREYSAFLAQSNTEKRFVSFDGKVLRGSFDHFKDQKASQVLIAFMPGCCIILAHEEIARKTNEIPAAQELIQELGLSDCIFTFDAINCQKKTLEVAKKTGNDVIVQVKGNQKTLFDDCQSMAATCQSSPYNTPQIFSHDAPQIFTQVHFWPPPGWIACTIGLRPWSSGEPVTAPALNRRCCLPVPDPAPYHRTSPK